MICFVCLFAFCKEAFYFAPNAGCHDATYLRYIMRADELQGGGSEQKLSLFDLAA